MTREEAITKLKIYRDYLCKMSSVVDVNEVAKPFNMAIETLERKRGEWIEKDVVQDRRDATIPEWQSAKCSLCGKYHTTPYMYYFTNYDYCPNCGADMRKILPKH